MIPWRDWAINGAVTILGAVLGAACTTSGAGAAVAGFLLGHIIGSRKTGLRARLFAASFLLLFSTLPRKIDLTAVDVATAGLVAGYVSALAVKRR